MFSLDILHEEKKSFSSKNRNFVKLLSLKPGSKSSGKTTLNPDMNLIFPDPQQCTLHNHHHVRKDSLKAYYRIFLRKNNPGPNQSGQGKKSPSLRSQGSGCGAVHFFKIWMPRCLGGRERGGEALSQ